MPTWVTVGDGLTTQSNAVNALLDGCKEISLPPPLTLQIIALSFLNHHHL